MPKKVLLLLAIILVTASSFGLYAFADSEEADDTLLRYDNVSYASTNLSISQGVATVKASAEGKTGVTKIKCTMTIQKYNSGSWSAIHSWSKEVNAKVLSLKKTYSVSHGTYRTKAIFKVYKNSSYETVTKYSSSVTY